MSHFVIIKQIKTNVLSLVQDESTEPTLNSWNADREFCTSLSLEAVQWNKKRGKNNPNISVLICKVKVYLLGNMENSRQTVSFRWRLCERTPHRIVCATVFVNLFLTRVSERRLFILEPLGWFLNRSCSSVDCLDPCVPKETQRLLTCRGRPALPPWKEQRGPGSQMGDVTYLWTTIIRRDLQPISISGVAGSI